MPRTFSCQLPRAVSTSTGAVTPASRQRRSRVSPSIAGSPRSSTTASYRSVAPGIGTRAVAGAVHRVARRGQRRGELRRQRRFVFDDQDSHALPRFLIAQVDLNAS